MGQSWRQSTMFGVDPEPEVDLNIYHDESGSYAPHGPDRWLLHGVLFVPAAKQSKVFSSLQAVRDQAGYAHEVHYRTIGKSASGPKVRCCMGWLERYARQLSEFCWYHCLAVDVRSEQFRHDEFREPHHVYNYFARVAIVGGIAWCLKPFPRVAAILHSDDKARVEGDNFDQYIPREVCRTIDEKRRKRRAAYPELRLLAPRVVLVPSDPAEVDAGMAEECELTQLVDLLTSAVGQALSSSSARMGKVVLGRTVATWIHNTRKPPWLQSEELHRRFSVSCFPDAQGRFYDPTLAVTTREQPRLFGDE
ncbi:MAG: hypothetical protein WBB22_03650 [Anaerolineae bacterium]